MNVKRKFHTTKTLKHWVFASVLSVRSRISEPDSRTRTWRNLKTLKTGSDILRTWKNWYRAFENDYSIARKKRSKLFRGRSSKISILVWFTPYAQKYLKSILDSIHQFQAYPSLSVLFCLFYLWLMVSKFFSKNYFGRFLAFLEVLFLRFLINEKIQYLKWLTDKTRITFWSSGARNW